jgi:hypothetical protein
VGFALDDDPPLGRPRVGLTPKRAEPALRLAGFEMHGDTISITLCATEGPDHKSRNAPANCAVSPIRSSNCRNPASLVSAAAVGSTTTDLPKKSNDSCQTVCKTITGLPCGDESFFQKTL